MILITHDLGIGREVCDKVAIMYAGEMWSLVPLEQIYWQYLSSIHKRDCLVRFRIWNPSCEAAESHSGLMPDPANLPEAAASVPDAIVPVKMQNRQSRACGSGARTLWEML